MEPLALHQNRDTSKLELCKKLGISNAFFLREFYQGITLIEVPYWWDRKFSSLAATLYSQRPELFKERPIGDPIPTSPPSHRELMRSK